MSHPPSMPHTPPAEPTTCSCGYDLTGLPRDADAKCPECGAVLADLKPLVPRFDRWRRHLAMFLSPSVVGWLWTALESTAVATGALPDLLVVVLAFMLLVSGVVSMLACWLLIVTALRITNMAVMWLVFFFVCVPVSFLFNGFVVFLATLVLSW